MVLKIGLKWNFMEKQGRGHEKVLKKTCYTACPEFLTQNSKYKFSKIREKEAIGCQDLEKVYLNKKET